MQFMISLRNSFNFAIRDKVQKDMHAGGIKFSLVVDADTSHSLPSEHCCSRSFRPLCKFLPGLSCDFYTPARQ